MYAIGQSFIVVSDPNCKHKLPIWSHCLGGTMTGHLVPPPPKKSASHVSNETIFVLLVSKSKAMSGEIFYYDKM